jgi:dCTP deaminase
VAVLCDSELLATLDAGQLEVDPKPPVDHFTPCSIDLTLGVELKRWKPAGGITIDPADPKFNFAQIASSLLEPMPLDSTGAVVINPQEFLLGITHERVHLPSSSRLCARVEGRSTLARLGLGVHVTAPTIHAGWNGKIALEIAHHGNVPIRLVPGLRICQLIVEQLFGTPRARLRTAFQNQTTVKGPL